MKKNLFDHIFGLVLLMLLSAASFGQNARTFTGKVTDSGEAALPGAKVIAKNINIILDERARKFCGEQQRWFDLKRTGKLIERVTAYNGNAKTNIKSFHTLRPIPTPQIDAVTNLTTGPDPEGFWQNEGY